MAEAVHDAVFGGRAGEVQINRLRTSRTFCQDSGWWLRTREGHALGPYPTQFDADLVAALLVAQLQQVSTLHACRRVIYNFRHDDRFPTIGAESAMPAQSTAQVSDQTRQVLPKPEKSLR